MVKTEGKEKDMNIDKSKAMAARVKRWHGFPVLHQQSVGEHTHRVVTIYLELFNAPRKEVLIYIVYHDLGELYSGDTPFVPKKALPGLKEALNIAEKEGLKKLDIEMPDLKPSEWTRFKVCDLLEMWEFANIEVAMGNRFGYIVIDNINAALDGLLEKDQKMRDHITKWMEKRSV
jgi:hypothetical protein